MSLTSVLTNNQAYLQSAIILCISLSHYIIYLLLLRGGCDLWLYTRNMSSDGRTLIISFTQNKQRIINFIALLSVCSTALLYSEEKYFESNFLSLFIAYAVVDFFIKKTGTSMEQSLAQSSSKANASVSYGVGMACSFFEGYLTHIIPSDGSHFVGFQENIANFENKEGITFPVKVLFLIITKSMFCPPDMSFFNKNAEHLPKMEACKSLDDVTKDVAGVKKRTYRNSAYKIIRPGDLNTVHVAAEFATPLHTLYKALERRFLYEKLAEADVSEIVHDFCTTLESVIAKSHECRGKCVLVYFDEEKQNLADVILDKIKELEPDFEEIIRKGNEMRKRN